MNMVTTHTFDAPVVQVWKAWSNPEHLMRWWGPTGFTAPVAKMDFRAGGTSLVCMRSPEGQAMYNLWVYQKIEPMQRIDFTQYWADPDGHKIEPTAMGLPADFPYEVPHELTFRAISDERTELTITEYGYPSAQHVNMSRAGMQQCLDKLAASLTPVR
ncbi:MAG: SRPBCC domain-containing protein [Bacteroidetes bacterium]|nr:SRPBCC domain-containing protein [Fibrella sp.]